jgi:hypothetical protein
MIDLLPVTSSNVDKVGYDEEKQELYVLFKTGGCYIYEMVTKDIHTGIMAADSVGRYVHKVLVKGKYKYRKVLT